MMPDPQTPKRIAILPDRLIDQIAAGEVVERPASVVKELIENALDAAARNITIEVTDAGTEQITIQDDGQGMTAEEIELAVQRHATSKIRAADDLNAISSFGFRGEALPSIASVSRLEITSRAATSESGARRFWEGGTLVEREEVGAPIGTRVKVKNLFYNTPARRKFLKSATTETKHIIETVTSFAAAFVHLGFRLTIENKEILHTPPADTSSARMGDLFGAQLADKLVAFSGGEGDLLVSGWAGRPDIARPTRGQMLFFVNGRKVSSASLSHAVSAGYGELIPKGRFPFAVVFVEINPQWVDVNVHPTKREVRFLREHQVHDLIFYAINKTMHSTVGAVVDFDGQHQVPTSKGPQSSTGTLPLQWKKERWDGAKRAADSLNFVEQAYSPAKQSPNQIAGGQSTTEFPSSSSGTTEPVDGSPDQPAGPSATVRKEIGDVSGIDDLWQFNNLYIMARVGEDLMLVDQHSAHERVLYEQILDQLAGRPPESQRILFPESIELEAFEYETFEKNTEVFTKMGFAVRPFGPRVVLLEGTPPGLKQKNPVTLFRWILDDLSAAVKAGDDLQKRAAASYACRAAVMAGDRLNKPEMRALFTQLFACENPFVCPHGRPTMVRIPMIEFDKKFCRRK